MEYFAGSIDTAVVGAGHAGIEAALACARTGIDTVLFVHEAQVIGYDLHGFTSRISV